MSKFDEIILSSEGDGEIILIKTPIGDQKGYKEMLLISMDGGPHVVTDKNLEEFAIKILSVLGYKIRPL